MSSPSSLFSPASPGCSACRAAALALKYPSSAGCTFPSALLPLNCCACSDASSFACDLRPNR
eukprot:11999011-Prorocentrum_lima.AAC.1